MTSSEIIPHVQLKEEIDRYFSQQHEYQHFNTNGPKQSISILSNPLENQNKSNRGCDQRKHSFDMIPSPSSPKMMWTASSNDLQRPFIQNESNSIASFVVINELHTSNKRNKSFIVSRSHNAPPSHKTNNDHSSTATATITTSTTNEESDVLIEKSSQKLKRTAREMEISSADQSEHSSMDLSSTFFLCFHFASL
jgi:hypothetical protein